MASWRREAEEILARELAGIGTWIEWNEAADLPRAYAPVVLSAVGHAIDADERRQVLETLAATFSEGHTLVVVDHNRPRRFGAALAAAIGAPAVPGGSPAARWRRLADPVARAVQSAGFRVDRLRLVAGERVQVVIATRTRAAAPMAQGRMTVAGTQRSRGPKNGN